MVQDYEDQGFEYDDIYEPLTNRIANILRAYPDGTQIARELLQNSDDAQSKVQWYLLDHRDHTRHAPFPGPRLFHNGLEEFMGPALLAGNDSLFQEVDFKSLKNLASSEKQMDKSKIGQMGIGFNSIYHITDCPSLISGDKVMVIDPHKRIFKKCTLGGNFVATNWAQQYPDQFRPFSAREEIDFTKPYSGTIFRLPLRTSEQAKNSSLSKYSRTPEEMLKMLMELKDEALKALLFLKHVEKIVIYERKEDQGSPTKLFEIEIVNADEVRAERLKMHNRFKDHDGTIECPIRPIFKLTHIDGQKTVENWQVTTRIGDINKTRATMLENTGDENIGYHKLTPWVGIAAPLDHNIDLDISGLFCFLPIGDIQLPFPVHLNGHFAVEQSRRDIWTNFDKKIKIQSSAGIESLWNVHLFEEQIPEAYALFLENVGLDHGANYNLWPKSCGSGIGRDKIWKDVLKNTLKAILSKDRPVFICGPTPDGGMKIIRYSELYIAGPDMDAFPRLKTALHGIIMLAENIPDIILSELKNQTGCIERPSRILTSARVIQLLRDTKKQWSGTADDATRVEMIKYCLKDDASVDLSGLSLLPLAGGLWTEFNREKAFERFRVSKKAFKVLSISFSELIDIEVEDYPFDEIEKGRRSTFGYWKTMQPSKVAERIKREFDQLIHADNAVPTESISQNSCQFATDAWLADFWNMVDSLPSTTDRKEVLSVLEGCHLIPIRHGYLAPLLSDRPVIFLNQDASNDTFQATVEILDRRLDCPVFRDISMDSTAPLVEYFADIKVGTRILTVLSKVKPEQFQKLTTADGKTLKRYLTEFLSRGIDLELSHCEALRRLPVFDLYDGTTEVPLTGSSDSRDWYIAQGYHFSSQQWIPSMINLLSEEQPMKHYLYHHLKIPFLSKSDYLYMLILELQKRPTSEWDPIISELFMGYNEHKHKDFNSILCSLAFVQVDTILSTNAPIRIVPGSVVNSELSKYFTDEEAVFPAGRYADSAFRWPLEHMGMMCRTDDTFIKKRFATLFKDSMVVGNASHKKSAQALYELLDDKFSVGLEGKWFLTLPWLYVDSGKLCRSCECRPKEDRCLVGEQMPISEFSPSNKLLRKHLGWATPPPLDKVLAHFISLLDSTVLSSNKITKLEEQDLLPIYKYLADKVHDPLSKKTIIKTLSNKSWIMIHGRLYSMDKVAFKMEHELSPYYVQLPRSDSNGLFRELGVREDINQNYLVAILDKINASYGDNECLRLDDAELARKVLNVLSKMELTDALPDLPVLTKDGSLRRLKDVVYDDRSTRRRSNDEALPYIFLDSAISKATAQGLLIDMFSVRTWQESRDPSFAPFFQEESIVNRIKNILKDYEPSGIFNEYLQNASDAGATKFSVLLDTQSYGTDKILRNQMAAWQGPALVFYNDAIMSEDDFFALCKLGEGNKRKDASKIGCHGLGFNSAYHFTDVPSIVSGNYLVFFDPHTSNLPSNRDLNGNPIPQKGYRYDIRKLSREAMTDQLQPYIGHFGCDMESTFKGTLFRIPLRIKESPLDTESSFGDGEWNTTNIRKLFNRWVKDAKIGMLFLKKVNEIEFYEDRSLIASVTRYDHKDDSITHHLSKSSQHHGGHTNIIDMKILDNSGISSNQSLQRWLVYTENALPKHTPQSIQNDVLKNHWSTEYGVAIPITNQNLKPAAPGEMKDRKQKLGLLMAHLATPIETKLPFHIHGGFILTTNRRNFAVGGDIGKPAAKWNGYLLETLLPLAAIHAYEVLLRWMLRSSSIGGPQVHDFDRVMQQYFQQWPLTVDDSFASLYQKFFLHAYTSPVFPCRDNSSKPSIEFRAGEDVVLSGHSLHSDLKSRVFAWLRDGGYLIAEIPHKLQYSIQQIWSSDESHPFIQVDCNLLRKRLREDPEFIPRQMKLNADKKYFLEEIFKGPEGSSISIEEPLNGLCVVPLLNGNWMPLDSFPVYYIATHEVRQLVEGKDRLVDTEILNSLLSGKVTQMLIKDPLFGIEYLPLDMFASIALSEYPYGINEDKREGIWRYLEKFEDLTLAQGLPIIKTTSGSAVTLKKAIDGIEISRARLPVNAITTIGEFFRRLGVVVFDMSRHRNHKYLLNLQIDYSERRALELIAKNWRPSFAISSGEAEWLRKIITSSNTDCSNATLRMLGELPIWKTFSPARSPLISANRAIYITDHTSLEDLGTYPTILKDVQNPSAFEKMGSILLCAADILRDHIMPKFTSGELQCIDRVKSSYLGLCRSIITTAASFYSNQDSQSMRVLQQDRCFLSRNGAFHTLADMFDPNEDLAQIVFANERHRFPDNDLYRIFSGHSVNLPFRKVSSHGVLEQCAQFVLDEIESGIAPADQTLSKAKCLVRYIYNFPNTHGTDWMDPKWAVVPCETFSEYPYDQHVPAHWKYMPFSSLCYPNDRNYIWTQRCFFPQDMIPSPLFKQVYPSVGSFKWRELCQHLNILAKNIAPTLSSTDRQLKFKSILFSIYKALGDYAGVDQGSSENIKQYLTETMTVPYILNGDDKDPTMSASWFKPTGLILGVDHKIRDLEPVHSSLLEHKNFLSIMGVKEIKSVTRKAKVTPQRELGVLEKRIITFFETQDAQNGFMDVKFVFERENKSILAHKIVLASMNEEIIRQLTGRWSATAVRDPSNPGIHVIYKNDRDDRYSIFWGLLHYFYTDELIVTNGPPIVPVLEYTPTYTKDQISERVDYLTGLQQLADLFFADRLKALIAAELMLPGMVLCSNVFAIRKHAKRNRDDEVFEYCNQFIRAQDKSLMEDYLEDEIEKVKVRLAELKRLHGGSTEGKKEENEDAELAMEKELLNSELTEWENDLWKLRTKF
ncbi:hypothetical protein FBU30_006781 [Linnemannia zychae]|nr:hypothetical protein FBU30_006781 [Linnemannia zychae]